MKWLKRLLIAVCVLLVLGIGLAVTGYVMFRGRPAWYTPHAWTAQQLEQHAGQAERKFADVQNWVAEGRAREAQAVADPRTPVATAPSSQERTFEFTSDELNAFFQKWTEFYHWDSTYGRYLKDPMLVLRDGRVIVAAFAPRVGAVVSVQFVPRLDEQGRLEIEQVRVLAGRLPVPWSIWRDDERQLRHALQARLPPWQGRAAIGSSGSANDAAVYAALGKLALHALDQQPSAPVILVPVVAMGRSGHIVKIPVKITQMSIEDGRIMLVARTLDAGQRDQFLEYLRQPVDIAPEPASASASATASEQ